MTDARYSYLHMSDMAIRALDFGEEGDGFGDIPAFDDVIPIPWDLDPPRPDDDETLPSKAHPSYPYGRPYQMSTNSALGSMHAHPSLGGSSHHDPLFGPQASLWQDLGLRSLLPEENAKEVPPGMAGAKRGPERDRSVGASSISGESGDDQGGSEEEREEGEGEGEDEGTQGAGRGSSVASRTEDEEPPAGGGAGLGGDSLIEEDDGEDESDEDLGNSSPGPGPEEGESY